MKRDAIKVVLNRPMVSGRQSFQASETCKLAVDMDASVIYISLPGEERIVHLSACMEVVLAPVATKPAK